MLIAQTHKFLTQVKPPKNQTIFWLTLSLTIGFIYSLLSLQQAFSGDYIVQDDARQHVVWMLRFIDPDVFPKDKDLIANYFQSVAPIGYKAVYQIPAMLGINPLILNKFFPVLLTLITTGYCFGLSMQLLPVPATGFISTLLLNQNLWMKDDLVSATPRAFVYPLLMAFLYYLLRSNLLGVTLAIALLSLFYPQGVFICAVILILRMFHWQGWRPFLSQNRADLVFCATGLGVAFVVMLPFALSASQFGPTITANQAKQLPEFLPGGRSSFFLANPIKFYLKGDRSGMFPRSLFTPVTLCAGLLLPIILALPSRFPLVRQITSKIVILLQILAASIFMFFAAHAVLFKLHLPNRYTGVTFRLILALASAIAFTAILDALLRWAMEKGSRNVEDQLLTTQPKIKYQTLKRVVALGVTLVIAIALIAYPSFVGRFPKTANRAGENPDLYRFFQQTPKDSLIASLAEEINNIPAFSQRSVLVGSEFAIPYQLGYYRQFRQRTVDLIRAQYSPNLIAAKNLIRQYQVNYFLIDTGGLTTEYLANNKRIQQYQPVAKEMLEQLQRGKVPALSKVMKVCRVFENEKFLLLQASCIEKYNDRGDQSQPETRKP